MMQKLIKKNKKTNKCNLMTTIKPEQKFLPSIDNKFQFNTNNVRYLDLVIKRTFKKKTLNVISAV